MQFLRFRDVIAKTGVARISIYRAISRGEFPPQVKLSDRTAAFVEAEVSAVLAARVAGQSPDQIRALVADLVAARQRQAA